MDIWYKVQVFCLAALNKIFNQTEFSITSYNVMCVLPEPLVRAHVIVECAPLSLLGQINPPVCLLIIISLYSPAPIICTAEAEAASMVTCTMCLIGSIEAIPHSLNNMYSHLLKVGIARHIRMDSLKKTFVTFGSLTCTKINIMTCTCILTS